MKVGAGGLQSQILYEGLAVLRPDVVAEKELSLARNRTWPEEELVRLVEELNLAAALFNYPYRFRVERDRSGRIGIFRYREGKEEAEEITPEEAKALKEKLQPKGEGLDARA
ncbi:hypothetical protein [Ammonifex thiophilus]|uniref:Uncharacterized protein n=1 Tax=Ammonifex thiophilus TaxID=444093 RepID=A0A3D8P7D9_9THEO|nr:hypothetical protein [Ammonifex thiophilus]RDV84782.1 hypothetical protein DXX99_01690 [Ammonifex thiophilus]